MEREPATVHHTTLRTRPQHWCRTAGTKTRWQPSNKLQTEKDLLRHMGWHGMVWHWHKFESAKLNQTSRMPPLAAQGAPSKPGSRENAKFGHYYDVFVVFFAITMYIYVYSLWTTMTYDRLEKVIVGLQIMAKPTAPWNTKPETSANLPYLQRKWLQWISWRFYSNLLHTRESNIRLESESDSRCIVSNARFKCQVLSLDTAILPKTEQSSRTTAHGANHDAACQNRSIQSTPIGQHLMATDGYRWLQMARDGYRWLQMATNGYRWLQMAAV